MRKTWYPQAALEGFGKAIASRLGISVNFAANGNPRTDGETIYLTPLTEPLDDLGFACECATVLHEAAHCFYGSVPRHKAFAGDPAHPDYGLRHQAMNAVLDIADESRLCWVVSSAERLFRVSANESAARLLREGAMANGDPVWCVLVVGILRTQSAADWHRVYGDLRTRDSTLGDMALCVGDHLRTVSEHRRIMGKAPTSRHRTALRWKKIEQVAESIVSILSALPRPPSGSGGGGGGQGRMGGKPKPGGKAPAGTPTASAQDGEDVAAGSGEALADAAQGQMNAAKPGQGNGGGASTGNTKPAPARYGPDARTYRELVPVFSGLASRLAQHDHADGLDAGFASGPRLGRDFTRVFTDGRVFCRKTGDGEKLNVVVALDTSRSMASTIREVCATAQAFVDAIKAVAESVTTLTFDGEARHVPDFRTINNLGGSTQTDEAIDMATGLLKDTPGRRLLVVVTDGRPGSPSMTQMACRRAQAKGIKILGVAYGTDISSDGLYQSMPGAATVAAPNSGILRAALHTAIGRIVR